ncbi:hypothetical protein RT761_01222 [Atribacter laminatus]|uniref:Uncharacterized protein n=1 Tax=Atribacter laminatus TaxID=2847778 RepID=A0A7T1ALA5_ATRLM|nr:hypothetical protein RT761_01222 [Atribacter laminatus]
MNSWFDRFQTRKTYLEKSTLNNYLKSLELNPALPKYVSNNVRNLLLANTGDPF